VISLWLPGHLARLRLSYMTGGIASLHQAHQLALRESPLYHLFWRLTDRVFPFTILIELGVDLNAQIGAQGLHRACRQVFEQLCVPIEVQLSAPHARQALTSPCLIYSNHTSMITPLILAATLECPDLKIMAMRYVHNLLPNFRRSILPIDRTWSDELFPALNNGFAHLLASLMLSYLEPRASLTAARDQNQLILRQAAQHVLRGGATLIFPAGGVRRPARWFPGIGAIVAHLLQARNQGVQGHAQARLPPLYLLPVCVHNDSNVHIRSGIIRNMEGARQPSSEQPIRVEFAEPLSLEHLSGWERLSAQEITFRLKDHYLRTFNPPG